jgi:hypothetical protein
MLLAAAVCVVVALVLAPYIPEPGGSVVAVIAWIGAALCAVLAVVQLVRGGANL